MSIVSEAKSLVKSAKYLEYYSSLLKKTAEELHHHNKNYESAKTDEEKQHHLKNHYITFAKAKSIKLNYEAYAKEIEKHLRNIEVMVKKVE